MSRTNGGKITNTVSTASWGHTRPLGGQDPATQYGAWHRATHASIRHVPPVCPTPRPAPARSNHGGRAPPGLPERRGRGRGRSGRGPPVLWQAPCGFHGRAGPQPHRGPSPGWGGAYYTLARPGWGALTILWLVPVVGVELLVNLLFLGLDHGGVALCQFAEEGRWLAGVAWRLGAHPAAKIRHPRSVGSALSLHTFDDGALVT